MVVARRIVTIAIAMLALWVVAIVIFGAAYGGTAGSRVASRVAESLQATATVGTSRLAMVRGRLELERLSLRKDDHGHLGIDIAEVRCELPGFGLALFDRDCRDLVIRGVRVEVSSAAVLQFKRVQRDPVRVGNVVVDDAVFAFMPSALLLSLGRIEIRIDHAEAGATTFKTPVSWLFSLRELRATIALPGNISMTLAYAGGTLTVAGGIFGSTPVELPFALPVADASDDAQAEIAKVIALGRDLAERLVARRAEDWIKSKL
jgi:hypothetical protein